MAIIYSYPQINLSSISADDLMIISDMNADGRPTKSLTLKNLADFVTSTGTGTGTTNKIIKWSDGPAGLLGDSIMTENATQIDLAGTFLSTSSPTATSGPVHAIRADQSTTTGGAFNIALYGDTKHTGATQANSNYGIYTKAEFEGTGGYTGIILGGTFEGRYDGSGTNGANASLYGTFSKANVTGASSGDIQYMIGSNVTSEMSSGTTTDVEFLQGQHTNVTLNSGNVSGDIAVNILDFDYTAGTLQGDFAYLQIQNDPVPTPSSGTARAINSDSTLPSHFSGQVEVPLIPTSNPHATSKQYVDTQIASIPAGLVFKGNWDANANSPTLASGVGTVGNYYVVSVAGNTNLDGITDWEVGDWAVFVEVGGVDKWDKIDQTFVQGAGATGQVSFWNGINSVTGDNDLYWDNVNKRLGIGTTSPSAGLQVAKGSLTIPTAGASTSSACFGNDTSDDNYGVVLGANSSGVGYISSQRTDGTATTYNLAIQPNGGNVGIGTTTMPQKLTVDGNLQLNGTFPKIVFSDTNSNPDFTLIGANGYFDIYDETNSITRMRIDSSGDVGIGTTSPAAKLDISNGTNSLLTLSEDSGRGLLRLYRNTASAYLQAWHDGTNGSISTTAGSIILSPSSGNVGIGTATPAAALDVIGRIGLNDGNNNVSVGDNAGAAITVGGANTLIGINAGDQITTESDNVAIGAFTLSAATPGARNVAIGSSALNAQIAATTAYNIAIGYDAGKAVTTGVENTLIGGLAGDAITTGAKNVVLGYSALSSETAGSKSIAIGNGALFSQNTSGDVFNVAVGHNAGQSVTTGVDNTLIGGLAGDAITTGSYNAAVGRSSLGNNTIGSSNVAFGWNALAGNVDGSKNVAIGHQSLRNMDPSSATDTYNTALGYHSGLSITTATGNTLVGGLAGQALVTGDSNVAIGYNALSSETIGNGSVAIGVRALEDQQSGAGALILNTAVGYEAGKNINGGPGTGNENTAIGARSLDAETTGEENTAVGVDALGVQNGADKNTALGWRAGYTTSTGSNVTLIGYNALASTGTVSNEITLGDSNVTALRCAVTSITSLSDERDKSDIKDLTYGLELIDSLKPKEFVWDNRAEIDAEGNEFYSANKGKKDFGFIAQEVKELDDDTLRLVYDENPERLEMSYGKLVPILVKAIQELSAEVKILKNK